MGNRTNFKQRYDLLLGLSRSNNYIGCWFLQSVVPNCLFLGIRFHKRKMSTCNPCSSFLLQINQRAHKCFVWESEDGVMRRGHKKAQRDPSFPTGLPTHATDRSDHGGTRHTHRHILGTRSNQERTRHSSVLCSWVHRHTRRSDRTRCRPRQRRHTSSLEVRVHIRPALKAVRSFPAPRDPGRAHRGRKGRSDVLAGSGHIDPRPHPGGTGSAPKCHTPPALSPGSHRHILCADMMNGKRRENDYQ